MVKVVHSDGLRDVGRVHWKEVLDRKLYSEGLMWNKNPDVNLKEKNSTVVEPMSFGKTGVKFECIFDREFIIAKLSKFLSQYLDGFTEEECLEFCKEAYHYNKTQQIEDAVNSLVSTLGHDAAYWKKLILSKQ